MSSEKHVKHKVKKLLDKHGWFWWMVPANGYGKGGVSDFHALKNGVFLAIETKYGANKPTALQKQFCESIMSCKGFAFVVNEKNLDWLDRWLTCFESATVAVSQGNEVAHTDGADMLNAIASLTKLLA